MNEKRQNHFDDVIASIRASAEGVERAAHAMQAAAEAQQRLTEAHIRLRDACRRAAEMMRIRTPEERVQEEKLRTFLADMVATARRADWHINTVMAQCIRKPFCRKKARMLRSMEQAQRANEELRDYLREIVERFPDQETSAAELRTRIERTDRSIEEIRGLVPRLPFIRTATDEPDV